MEYSRVKDEKNIANIYQQMLNEDMTSGGAFGGDIGGHAGMENTDWFAPGDARNPYGMGITTRSLLVTRSGRLKKKKSKKRKKKVFRESNNTDCVKVGNGEVSLEVRYSVKSPDGSKDESDSEEFSEWFGFGRWGDRSEEEAKEACVQSAKWFGDRLRSNVDEGSDVGVWDDCGNHY